MWPCPNCGGVPSKHVRDCVRNLQMTVELWPVLLRGYVETPLECHCRPVHHHYIINQGQQAKMCPEFIKLLQAKTNYFFGLD